MPTVSAEALDGYDAHRACHAIRTKVSVRLPCDQLLVRYMEMKQDTEYARKESERVRATVANL